MKIRILFLITLLFFSINSNIYSQQPENIIIDDIAKNIDNYKNKTITLSLRLKNLDTTFDKIVFYDRKNFDIVFDISELKKDKSFQKQALNIHQGLEYYVIFTIKGLIGEKSVSGELKSFSPVILSKLPN
jgi:hypothetical protein